MNYDRERNGDVDGPDTEDDILNQVEDITGESFDENDETETDDDEPSEDDEQEEQPADKQAAPETAQSRDRFAEQRARHEEIAKRIPSRRGVDYNYNENGDVINPQTGEVLFKNGTVERAMFAELRDTQFKHDRVQRIGQDLQNRYNAAERIIQSYKAIPDAAQTLGLDTRDQVRAFAMMAEYKKNPVQAFRKMLNEYQVDGGDLSDIFDNLEKIQTEGLESKIKALIEPIVAPQRQREQEATQHQELVNQLNNEITTFFNNYPEAEQHADLITHVINKGDAKNLNDAWMKIQRFASHNGLDTRRDFRSQLEARQAPAPQQRPQQRPLPNGRANGNSMRPSRDAKPSYEMRNRDIVADAMREAGFDV